MSLVRSISLFLQYSRSHNCFNLAERFYAESRRLVSQLSSLLVFVANIHIARHVDIDGIRREPGNAPTGDLYTQTVDNARLVIRTLEAAMQSLYDDSSSLLVATQGVRRPDMGLRWKTSNISYDHLDDLAFALKANLGVIQQSFEALLSIGHDQADMAQGDYNGSIEWRMSRLSVIDTQFGGAHRPTSMFNSYDTQGDDLVDMELAFQKPGAKAQTTSVMYHNGSMVSETTLSVSDMSHAYDTPKPAADADTSMHTLVSTESNLEYDSSPLFEEDRRCLENTADAELTIHS